jgi:hypothetical protein
MTSRGRQLPVWQQSKRAHNLGVYHGIRRPLNAGVWAKEQLGFYIEPTWCSARLFAVEQFSESVWDPFCGIGRIPESAQHAGHRTIATDILNRGYPGFDEAIDFFQCRRFRAPNIVTNPVFHLCGPELVEHSLKLTTDKVAMIWLLRRLNAARWLRNTPLARIFLLVPRPSMPPGQVIIAGEKAGGGTQDFVWLVWRHGHVGPPAVHWLHRDAENVS